MTTDLQARLSAAEDELAVHGGYDVHCRTISETRARLDALSARIQELEGALRQVEAEMRAGFGSSFGETREQVRRALRGSKNV